MAKQIINIIAYPYATQNGTIAVPTDIKEEDLQDYISEHFDEVVFEKEPELDYRGTEFDIY